MKKISLLFNDTFFCKCPVLIYLHARELFMFLCVFFSSADFLQNYVFTNKPLRTTIGVSNSLDPDQDRDSFGQPVCKRLLADDKNIRWHAKSYKR